MTCLLGINSGNAGVKALLFDKEGRELARAQRETGGTSPAPGQVERDAARLRGDLFDLVAELLCASCRDGDKAAGIGTSGHDNGLYLLDGAGVPLAAIQSLDSDVAEIVIEQERD